MQDNEEDWIFSDFSYGRAYSFAPRCAGFDVHSFPRGKERTKKTRQRLPPLEPALPAVSEMNGGNFCDSKSPPSAGHISHPADVQAGQDFFAVAEGSKEQLSLLRQQP